VDDVYSLLQSEFLSKGVQPVIVGHSFGGAVLMKLLEKDPKVAKGAGKARRPEESGVQRRCGHISELI
jgi:pimeloyl-ACP methyl ester carboxylesterase